MLLVYASLQAIGKGVIRFFENPIFKKTRPVTVLFSKHLASYAVRNFPPTHPPTLSMNLGGNLKYLVRYSPIFAGYEFDCWVFFKVKH